MESTYNALAEVIRTGLRGAGAHETVVETIPEIAVQIAKNNEAVISAKVLAGDIDTVATELIKTSFEVYRETMMNRAMSTEGKTLLAEIAKSNAK